MWICGPLRGAPPLSSPLHPFSWQRPQTAFSHAFPKSRYVDSIRLTSHNGEFVQQEEPHYLNPSVALSLLLWDRRTRLARSPQRLIKGRTKGEFIGSLWGSRALTLVCWCQVHACSPKTVNRAPSVDVWIAFTEKRTSKVNWIIFIEWPKCSPCSWMCTDFPTFICLNRFNLDQTWQSAFVFVGFGQQNILIWRYFKVNIRTSCARLCGPFCLLFN